MICLVKSEFWTVVKACTSKNHEDRAGLNEIYAMVEQIK